MEKGAFTPSGAPKLSPDTLAQMTQPGSLAADAPAPWASGHSSCSHCKRCTLRCEVLNGPDLDIGLVEESYRAIVALSADEQPAAVLQTVQDRPELYHALRRCCFCGYCTSTCQSHIAAPEHMREWRLLFMRAGLMPPDDSKLVMVDNEWHIFSAYRAIYGIVYPEFISLEHAAEQGPGSIDTLFFPGCSLVSYAPELMRLTGRWLDEAGISWALSDSCCGSPLMSAGLFDRAESLRRKTLDLIRAAGITRVLTVCPGCGEELAATMGDSVEIVPLPEVMLERSRAALQTGESAGFTPLRPSSITFFDSCHDRSDGRHGAAIRKLIETGLPEAKRLEMEHHGKETLCCGAGGAVASYDDDITRRRVWSIIDEARATGAETMITACPTCTYTIAQACLGAGATRGIDSHHYLELLFGQTIDWPLVFDQLGSMWEGEYGPWLTATFFA